MLPNKESGGSGALFQIISAKASSFLKLNSLWRMYHISLAIANSHLENHVNFALQPWIIWKTFDLITNNNNRVDPNARWIEIHLDVWHFIWYIWRNISKSCFFHYIVKLNELTNFTSNKVYDSLQYLSSICLCLNKGCIPIVGRRCWIMSVRLSSEVRD